jgi:hypothetical protein
VKVVEWTEACTDEVATWSPEPPYDFYDLEADAANAAAMRNPARRDHLRAGGTRRFEGAGEHEFLRMEHPA